MPTYLVETTARPGVTYLVAQDEYERLRDAGLLVDGPVEPSGPDVFDTEVSELVADGQSLTRAAIAGMLGGDLVTDPELTAALAANSTDDRNRANHTGTQASSTLSDLTETVQDIVGALIVAGTNTTVTYNDAAGTFTINATASGGGTTDAEIVRDTIGGALVAGAGVSITVNDAGDTITIASTAVLPTRTISTTAPLTGGGDLSVNRTLGVDAATATAAGVVELATDTETQTGTDTTRAITPANLAARTATETRTGVVELATTAEAATGTDTARAVTPAGLKAGAITAVGGAAELADIDVLTQAAYDAIGSKVATRLYVIVG